MNISRQTIQTPYGVLSFFVHPDIPSNVILITPVLRVPSDREIHEYVTENLPALRLADEPSIAEFVKARHQDTREAFDACIHGSAPTSEAPDSQPAAPPVLGCRVCGDSRVIYGENQEGVEQEWPCPGCHTGQIGFVLMKSWKHDPGTRIKADSPHVADLLMNGFRVEKSE